MEEVLPEQRITQRATKCPVLPGLAFIVLVLGFLIGSRIQPALLQVDTTTNLAHGAGSPMQVALEHTHYFLGDPQAPVTIIVFSDYSCHYCATLALDTLSQLVPKYVQSGKVRIGIYPVAYLGDKSRVAAEASACADEQGSFWAFHLLLLQQQTAIYPAKEYVVKLQQLAQQAGLEATQFAACLDTGRYAQRVQEDNAIARELGVDSIPISFINGQILMGAQPAAVFQRAIDTVR